MATNLYEVKNDAVSELVHTWEFIELGKWNNHRVYFKAMDSTNEFKSGFYFHALSWVSGPAIHGGKNDIWSQATEVENLAHGIAHHDGLRHIFIGDTESIGGYIYYPHPILMIELFDNLRRLEEMYCDSNEGNSY